MLRLTLAALALLAMGAAQPGDVARIDPLTVEDDDFARHRTPATWRGLTVEQIAFTEERATWRLWRIADPKRRRGPLWFVPHDDENAGFDAALVGLRAYGGVIVAVDSGLGTEATRRNRAVDFGRPVDPNRNFDTALPRYATRVLADLTHGAGPIIALHTNPPGLDPRYPICGPRPRPGTGGISIRRCGDIFSPSPSRAAKWPFDDEDTVAIVAHRAGTSPHSSYCGKRLAAADFNILFERVRQSDGSLSNFALLHGLPYLNFETRERGLAPAALADARDRLVAMFDKAMALCVAPTIASRPHGLNVTNR